MNVEPTDLAGALILTPRRFADDRGWFSETWNRAALADAGVEIDFVQDNHSHSEMAGTIRGLHAQAAPMAQDKLVRCIRGAIFDVAVDVRPGSATFGRWVGVDLTANNGRQFLIPKGFLHGFVTREPGCEVAYKCSAPYAPAREWSVRFDDPDLAIDWGLAPGDAVLSEKDAAAPSLADALAADPGTGGG